MTSRADCSSISLRHDRRARRRLAVRPNAQHPVPLRRNILRNSAAKRDPPVIESKPRIYRTALGVYKWRTSALSSAGRREPPLRHLYAAQRQVHPVTELSQRPPHPGPAHAVTFLGFGKDDRRVLTMLASGRQSEIALSKIMRCPLRKRAGVNRFSAPIGLPAMRQTIDHPPKLLRVPTLERSDMEMSDTIGSRQPQGNIRALL
jgi:hypothetical protein